MKLLSLAKDILTMSYQKIKILRPVGDPEDRLMHCMSWKPGDLEEGFVSEYGDIEINWG